MSEIDTSGANRSLGDRRALLMTFAAGFLAQATQIVLLRELLMAFSGVELVIGIALASWMLLVALGGILASTLLPAGRGAGPTMTTLLCSAFVPVGLSALLARAAPSWFGLESGQLMGPGSTVAMTLVVLAPAAVLAGGLFVSASR
ncbi:MAG: hypothetical protein ACYTFG_16525, partial [Planctomycetota bacterium]